MALYGIMVTHCRIALWSHQSAQTASSEQWISANSERLSERLSQSLRLLNRIYLEHNTTIEQCALPVTTIMALWQLTHNVRLHIVGLHCGVVCVYIYISGDSTMQSYNV